MIPVEAVLFDYGMVLSGPPNPAAWQRMKDLTGLTEELLHREYWAHRLDYDRGDLTGETYWHKAAAGAGIELTPTQLSALIDADTELWGQLNLPMLEWACRLQRAGIRIGILSNMPNAVEMGLRARHNWIESFDHHTWSHSIRLVKPHPAIYSHAVEGLQTPPANILFIDDKPENIQGAIAAGLQAIEYHDHATFERDMQTRGLTPLLQLERSAMSQNGNL